MSDDSSQRFTSVDPEWLPRIYEVRAARFLHDNDRIWSSGALLVPLSLAPFLALGNIRGLETAHFVVLGLASTTLIAFWFLISESHRRYQHASMTLMRQIEAYVGLAERPSPRQPTLLRARSARRGIVIMVPLLWILAAVVWPR